MARDSVSPSVRDAEAVGEESHVGSITKAPLEIEGRFRLATLRCGGAVCRFLGRLGRLAKPLAERAKLGDLRLAELVKAILEVVDRLVEPFLLVIRCGTNDSTADNVLKHLVARLIERRLGL